MADFTAHIGEGDEAPKFDKEEAEKYLKDKHIHKLMGTLLQSLVDSKPADPVDFLVESLTKMEAEESTTAAHIIRNQISHPHLHLNHSVSVSGCGNVA